MAEKLTPVYRAVMIGGTPFVRLWGRMTVEGLEHMPASGPVLLAANHDSYWDPVAIGVAAQSRRQVRALAKASMWSKPVVGWVLTGMRQIPIDRGKGDAGALERAVAELRAGACIGVFPEGTRSIGRDLRAHSGFGRLSEAVPEAVVVCASVRGTTEITAFPRRPDIHVRFFRPAGGQMQPDERPKDFAARLLVAMRADAPATPPGRKKPRTG